MRVNPRGRPFQGTAYFPEMTRCALPLHRKGRKREPPVRKSPITGRTGASSARQFFCRRSSYAVSDSCQCKIGNCTVAQPASKRWRFCTGIGCVPNFCGLAIPHLLNDWGIVEGRAEAGVLETQSQR